MNTQQLDVKLLSYSSLSCELTIISLLIFLRYSRCFLPLPQCFIFYWFFIQFSHILCIITEIVYEYHNFSNIFIAKQITVETLMTTSMSLSTTSLSGSLSLSLSPSPYIIMYNSKLNCWIVESLNSSMTRTSPSSVRHIWLVSELLLFQLSIVINEQWIGTYVHFWSLYSFCSVRPMITYF